MRPSLIPVIAVGASLTLFGGALAVLAIASRPPSTSPRPSPPVPSPAAPSDPPAPATPAPVQPPPAPSPVSSKAQAIAVHPWWKTRPTPEQVQQMASDYTRLSKSSAVLIDDHCKTHVVTLDSLAQEWTTGRANPVRVGHPRIQLDMDHWSTRPTEDEVLTQLKRLIDRAEFDQPSR